MKAKKIVLVSLLLGIALPGLSLASSDKVVHLALSNAIAAATQSGKLDGSVKFYLAGNQPSGQVTVVNDNVSTSKKTNAFGKSSQTTCDIAAQSALITLQGAAKEAGANAVIDIVSDYNHVNYSDPTNYECHVGFLMSGVALKAKLAKVH